MTLIYNHSEKSGQVIGQNSKGLLGYDKTDKTFSCDSSDLDCAGMPQIPSVFHVKVHETQNMKTFRLCNIKKDGENEVQYWMYKATDNSGIKFMIFND